MAFRLGPHGFAANGYGSFAGRLVSVTLTGAQTNAEAGTVDVVASTGKKTQFSPHGLVTYPRNFSKQVNQNVSVNLTGAAIELQWSTPDLADVTIYPDGEDIGAEGGEVASSVAFITTAAIAGEAGTVAVKVDIDAAITGAQTGVNAGTSAGIAGGGTDIGATPVGAAISATAGTTAAGYDWTQSITGAQINAEAAEVGLDIKRDVAATVAGAAIAGETADPALAGPHVRANVDGASISTHAGTVEQFKQPGRSKRRRYIVQIDDELIEVASLQAVQNLLEQVRELAEESAERDVTTAEVQSIPKVQVLTATGKQSTSKPIRAAVKESSKAIRQAYLAAAKRRAIDEEIRKLLIAKIELEEQDEEDALLAILFS